MEGSLPRKLRTARALDRRQRTGAHSWGNHCRWCRGGLARFRSVFLVGPLRSAPPNARFCVGSRRCQRRAMKTRKNELLWLNISKRANLSVWSDVTLVQEPCVTALGSPWHYRPKRRCIRSIFHNIRNPRMCSATWRSFADFVAAARSVKNGWEPQWTSARWLHPRNRIPAREITTS